MAVDLTNLHTAMKSSPVKTGGGQPPVSQAPANEIQAAAQRSLAKSQAKGKKQIKLKSLTVFTGQMALMLDTGTPVIECIEAVIQQIDDKPLSTALKRICSDVSGGMALGDALTLHPNVFDNAYVATIIAAESTGKLDDAFARLEQKLLRREEVIGNVRRSLTYPAILVMLSTSAVVFLVSFVVPKFAKIFHTNQVALPLPTRILLGISGIVSSYWIYIAVVLAALFIAMVRMVRSTRGRNFLERNLLNLPQIGPLIRELQGAQMLQTMGLLLTSGITIVETLTIAAQSSSNHIYRNLIYGIKKSIIEGDDFSSVFSTSPYFSTSVKQMIRTGEQSGRIGYVMTRISERMEADADRNLKNLVALVEPLIIILMGCAIGFIAVSILLPLFRLTSVLRGGH